MSEVAAPTERPRVVFRHPSGTATGEDPVPTGSTVPGPHRHAARRRAVIVLGALTATLVVVAVVAAAMGAYAVPPGEVLGTAARHLGLPVGPPADPTADALLWEIRFPRVVLAVVVGGSLAAAGAAMQGTFANPLAEPGIVGVSAGAVLGAAVQIVAGASPLGSLSLPLAAFVGGLVTVSVVYLASRADGRTEVVTLVLTGIAVNALVGALIGLVTYLSDDDQLRSLVFWTLGSMAQATWARVALVAPFAAVGVAAATAAAGRLDLLALGERPARHLGLDVERLRLAMLIVVAVLTAAAVAVAGQILFVGLVVPHLVRTVTGPGHRLLLPASALAGAVVLVVADLVARTVAAPAELPLGVLTALIGSPVFFWQLRRTRARQGGWA